MTTQQVPELVVSDPEAARALANVAFLGQFREPASPSDVAKKLGMPANLAHHHAQRAVKLGLLFEAGREKGRVLYQLAVLSFRIPRALHLEGRGHFEQSVRQLAEAYLHAYQKSESLVQAQLSGIETAGNAGDYRLMSRATVEAINALPEHNRVLRFVVPLLGFPSAEVGYVREERAAGESKYPLAKMLLLSLDAIVSSSMKPLRWATWLGFGGFALAVIFLVYAFVGRLAGHSVAGWASTLSVIALFGGVQLLCLGILGEYLGRMYVLLQNRPTHYIAYDSLDGGPDPAERSGASRA